MSDFITALTSSTTGITGTALWTDVTALVPFIVMIFGFAFSFRLLRRALKSGSKGKVNL